MKKTLPILPGNESLKRALEIASAGSFRARVYGPHEMRANVDAYAAKLNVAVEFVSACPCGYLGDYVKECRCSLREISAHMTVMKQRILDYPVVVEVARPSVDKIFFNTEEPVDKVLYRVQYAQEFMARENVTPGDMNAPKSEEDGGYILEVAVKSLGLFPVHVENILKVATVIAALSGVPGCVPAASHIAEAVRLQNSSWMNFSIAAARKQTQ